jgi:hypothetical protein
LRLAHAVAHQSAELVALVDSPAFLNNVRAMKRSADLLSVQRKMLVRRHPLDVRRIIVSLVEVDMMAMISICL